MLLCRNVIGFAAARDEGMGMHFFAEIVRCAFSYGCYQMPMFKGACPLPLEPVYGVWLLTWVRCSWELHPSSQRGCRPKDGIGDVATVLNSGKSVY